MWGSDHSVTLSIKTVTVSDSVIIESYIYVVSWPRDINVIGASQPIGVSRLLKRARCHWNGSAWDPLLGIITERNKHGVQSMVYDTVCLLLWKILQKCIFRTGPPVAPSLPAEGCQLCFYWSQRRTEIRSESLCVRMLPHKIKIMIVAPNAHRSFLKPPDTVQFPGRAFIRLILFSVTLA